MTRGKITQQRERDKKDGQGIWLQVDQVDRNRVNYCMTVRRARIGPPDFHPVPGNLTDLKPETLFFFLSNSYTFLTGIVSRYVNSRTYIWRATHILLIR